MMNNNKTYTIKNYIKNTSIISLYLQKKEKIRIKLCLSFIVLIIEKGKFIEFYWFIIIFYNRIIVVDELEEKKLKVEEKELEEENK